MIKIKMELWAKPDIKIVTYLLSILKYHITEVGRTYAPEEGILWGRFVIGRIREAWNTATKLLMLYQTNKKKPADCFLNRLPVKEKNLLS